ncbi:MAG TPA: hypothetical protein VN653_06815 [Anaerolineales bacterium]|nr:hypothetical protein [Anaerolineales bacterium]
MTGQSLWEPDTIITTISDIAPQLASWDKSTHPSQIRLQAYLQGVMSKALPLPQDGMPLFLHLEVDVQKPERLLKHHDLENYLTPLFGTKQLNASRFVLVTARKFVGGGSKLLLGTARPATEDFLLQGWNHFAYVARGSAQAKPWKDNLRNALAETKPLPLTDHAVEVQIAWACPAQSNWVALWKPTGDCMGPILGEVNPLRPFAPNDDRIVDLKFYRTLNTAMGNAVHIDMWWRAARSQAVL